MKYVFRNNTIERFFGKEYSFMGYDDIINEALAHIEKCVEEKYEYSRDFQNENSQISKGLLRNLVKKGTLLR